MWQSVDGALTKTFVFESFGAAIEFMHSAVPMIEKLDHHPTWTNTYNRLDVRMVTHDVGGVTDLDYTLAKQLDALFEDMKS